MIPFILAILIGAVLITPSAKHVRSEIEMGERPPIECTPTVRDGRRSALESTYAPHADLDMDSNEGMIRCRQLIMPPGLRSSNLEAIFANLQSFAANLSTKLATDQSFQNLHWRLVIFLDAPQINQKIAFALRTHLTESGLHIHHQLPLDQLPEIEILQDSPSRICDTQTQHNKDGLLYIYRSTVLSDTLRAAVCTPRGWAWL